MSALVVFSLLPQGMANHFHFLRIIAIATSSCPVLAHSSSFVITSGQKMLSTYMAESFIHKRLQFGKQSFG